MSGTCLKLGRRGPHTVDGRNPIAPLKPRVETIVCRFFSWENHHVSGAGVRPSTLFHLAGCFSIAF